MGRGKNKPSNNQTKKSQNRQKEEKKPQQNQQLQPYKSLSHDFNKPLPQKNSSGSPKKVQCQYELKDRKIHTVHFLSPKKSQR